MNRGQELDATCPEPDDKKARLWICQDEATKFTMGHVWADGTNAGSIDGNFDYEMLPLGTRELRHGQWSRVEGD